MMLDLEAGWKSFLHMKLAKDFPMMAAGNGGGGASDEGHRRSFPLLPRSVCADSVYIAGAKVLL